MVSPKRLLAVAYYYPPIKSIASVRSRNLVAESLNHFDEVVVLTTQNRDRLPADAYAPAETAVVRALPTLDFRTLFPRPAVKSTSRTADGLYRILNSFPFNLLAGIGGLLYVVAGVYMGARYVRRRNITHLYSSYFPYADHFICYCLVLLFPRLHWTADFRDLHVDPVAPEVIWPRFQRSINRLILRRSQLVTTVSEGLATALRRDARSIWVMPNAIARERLTLKSPPPQGLFFDIVYTGNLYAGRRDPSTLFGALRSLIDAEAIDATHLRLRYAGNDGAAWYTLAATHGLADCVDDLGMVPHTAAMKLQQSASLNLLLSWSSPQSTGVLTGKLYEYLAARRPILLLLKGTRDAEFEALFARTQAGLVAYSPPTSLLKVDAFVRLLYEKWLRDGTTGYAIDATKLSEFGWPLRVADWLDQIAKTTIRHKCT